MFGRTAQIRYNAQGVGTQTVNLGLNSSQQPIPLNGVFSIQGRTFLAEGDGWNLLPGDSVVVYGLTGNISVTHFGFLVPDDSNLPFSQQHSIIIITAIVFAVTVAIAVVIRFRVRS